MIDKEVVRKARQTDLTAFLSMKGEPIKRIGQRYTHKDHDSLIIKGNMFYWNSRQEKGNSLDFVRLYYGWDFERAVQELTGVVVPKMEYKAPQSKTVDFTRAKDRKQVIAYLCQTRKIDYDIVKNLLASYYISQDEKNNVVFKAFNENGEFVDGEVVGTNSKVRYKNVLDGTSGYGFNVTIGEPKKTLFFESCIDLLSYWTKYKDKISEHRLVSLSGVREDIFSNTLKSFSIPTNLVYLCVDRDKAGEEFVKAIQSKYEGVKTHLPPSGYKDWNDVLRGNSQSMDEWKNEINNIKNEKEKNIDTLSNVVKTKTLSHKRE